MCYVCAHTRMWGRSPPPLSCRRTAFSLRILSLSLTLVLRLDGFNAIPFFKTNFSYEEAGATFVKAHYFNSKSEQFEQDGHSVKKSKQKTKSNQNCFQNLASTWLTPNEKVRRIGEDIVTKKTKQFFRINCISLTRRRVLLYFFTNNIADFLCFLHLLALTLC